MSCAFERALDNPHSGAPTGDPSLHSLTRPTTTTASLSAIRSPITDGDWRISGELIPSKSLNSLGNERAFQAWAKAHEPDEYA
jgi:hypothetical protein